MNPILGRWHQAARSYNQAVVLKADSLKDEMDEALNKVEICKVELADADVFPHWLKNIGDLFDLTRTFQRGPPHQSKIMYSVMKKSNKEVVVCEAAQTADQDQTTCTVLQS